MPSKPRKPAEPVHGSAALFLRITNSKGVEKLYRLFSLNTDPQVANPAWRLFHSLGPDGFYDVHVDGRGASCTCPDFLSRRVNDRKGCKHVASLRAVGLLRPLRTGRGATV